MGLISTPRVCDASHPVTPLSLRLPLAFLPASQHDNLVPTMTSWEALSFYAGLVLPANTSADKKRARIQDVLSMMGLAKHRDTLVRSTHTCMQGETHAAGLPSCCWCCWKPQPI